eukprot:10942-Heterococcus_DN1.PRE.2
MQSCAAFEVTSMYEYAVGDTATTHCCRHHNWANTDVVKVYKHETDKPVNLQTWSRMTGRITTAALRGHTRTRLLPISIQVWVEKCALGTCTHTCSTSYCKLSTTLHIIAQQHAQQVLIAGSRPNIRTSSKQSCTLSLTMSLARSRQLLHAYHSRHSCGTTLRIPTIKPSDALLRNWCSCLNSKSINDFSVQMEDWP